MASYLFRTPSEVDYVQPFAEGMRPAGPRVPIAVGLCVYRLGGVWYSQRAPTPEQWAAADRSYLGGHVHTVSQAEADDLTAGGYGAYLTPA